jgi:hypothetical protein
MGLISFQDTVELVSLKTSINLKSRQTIDKATQTGWPFFIFPLENQFFAQCLIFYLTCVEKVGTFHDRNTTKPSRLKFESGSTVDGIWRLPEI